MRSVMHVSKRWTESTRQKRQSNSPVWSHVRKFLSFLVQCFVLSVVDINVEKIRIWAKVAGPSQWWWWWGRQWFGWFRWRGTSRNGVRNPTEHVNWILSHLPSLLQNSHLKSSIKKLILNPGVEDVAVDVCSSSSLLWFIAFEVRINMSTALMSHKPQWCRPRVFFCSIRVQKKIMYT